MSGSSEVKLGDSVLIVDDNDLVDVSRLSLKASASTATFFNRGLVQIWTVKTYFESNILGEKCGSKLVLQIDQCLELQHSCYSHIKWLDLDTVGCYPDVCKKEAETLYQ